MLNDRTNYRPQSGRGNGRAPMGTNRIFTNNDLLKVLTFCFSQVIERL